MTVRSGNTWFFRLKFGRDFGPELDLPGAKLEWLLIHNTVILAGNFHVQPIHTLTDTQQPEIIWAMFQFKRRSQKKLRNRQNPVVHNLVKYRSLESSGVRWDKLRPCGVRFLRSSKSEISRLAKLSGHWQAECSSFHSQITCPHSLSTSFTITMTVYQWANRFMDGKTRACKILRRKVLHSHVGKWTHDASTGKFDRQGASYL